MAYHSDKNLYRTHRDAVLGGVCSGLSEYLRIDVTIIRILFIIFGCAFGSAVFLYLILWAFLPVR